jgi:hypothetical protein
MAIPMTDQALQCAQCAKPLDSTDSVCAFCDKPEVLTQATHATSATHGKYHCPKCTLKFDQPDTKLTPEIVPWYRMHPEKPCCPHCGTFIRSKYSKMNIAFGWLIVPVIITREWFGFSNPVVYGICMAIVALCISWWSVAAWRLHRDASAYVEDKQ